jgi:plasmid stability protein
MRTLTIRNVPDEVHSRLRLRAARAGRSMESEVRAILVDATSADAGGTSIQVLRDWVERAYGPDKPSGVVEDLLAERRAESRRE